MHTAICGKDVRICRSDVEAGEGRTKTATRKLMIHACGYLNGHVGAWAPRHPQWQHCGALWLTARLLASEVVVCMAMGADAGEGGWHGAEVEKMVVCCDECMVRSRLVRGEGGCVAMSGRRRLASLLRLRQSGEEMVL